jgi:8-oxo-dGTP pyrophosphatase MutT (NUDIX family)
MTGLVRLDMHERINPKVFAQDQPVPTLVMLFCFGKQLLLVHPKSAPSNWYVPPQAHMEARDFTLKDAFTRAALKELGLQCDAYHGHTAKAVLEVVHAMPRERNGPRLKRLIFVVAKLVHTRLTPNEKEIAGMTWVASWDALESAFAPVVDGEREPKCLSTCQAVRLACKYKLLPWPLPEAIATQQLAA